MRVLASQPLAHMRSIYLSPGQAALPVLQHARQGDGAHQVLPRVLLRMPQDALRHPPEEVPQVQLRLRSERLSPHLHHLSGGGTARRKREDGGRNQRSYETRDETKELKIYLRQTFCGIRDEGVSTF